jgi:hypothetical protein
VISHTTRRFRERFAALPNDVQEQAREAYHRFRQDPHHPSLHFKQSKRHGTLLYSVRIGLSYRTLAYERDGAL